MQKNAHKTRAGLLLMAVLALGAAALYMLVNVDFENEKLFMPCVFVLPNCLP